MKRELQIPARKCLRNSPKALWEWYKPIRTCYLSSRYLTTGFSEISYNYLTLSDLTQFILKDIKVKNSAKIPDYRNNFEFFTFILMLFANCTFPFKIWHFPSVHTKNIFKKRHAYKSGWKKAKFENLSKNTWMDMFLVEKRTFVSWIERRCIRSNGYRFVRNERKSALFNYLVKNRAAIHRPVEV